MKRNEKFAFAWLIGWFVALWPIFYALDGSLFRGLLNGVIGLCGAIILIKYGNKI